MEHIINLALDHPKTYFVTCWVIGVTTQFAIVYCAVKAAL